MLTLSLEYQSQIPFYEQIYQKIKQMIREGELESGYKLPSERSLALHLQISRNTINSAYLQLLSEGYVNVKPKSGYYVAKINQITQKNMFSPISFTEEKKNFSEVYCYDFSPFSLYKEGFPQRIWEKLYRSCIRKNGNNLFLLGDKQGDFAVREAISKYLFEFRGFQANPQNIIIGAGADYLLLLLNQLFPDSSIIAMEDPSYLQAYKIFSSLKRKVLPIPLDEKGLSVSALQASSSNIVYLTPAHQFPLGIVMPASRRSELYAWASEKEDRYIIEDDHDSDFRYKGKPIPSIKEIDEKDRVIHIGTFSRTIAPAIRIGYLVLPDSLLHIYKEVSGFYTSTVPRLEQAVLAEFIEGGHYERHINKSKKLYKARHDALLSAWKIFEKKVQIFGENAGVHLAVQIKTSLSEAEILKKTASVGIRLYGLSSYFIGEKQKENYYKDFPIFLFGYGNMEEQKIDEGIRKLYRILDKK